MLTQFYNSYTYLLVFLFSVIGNTSFAEWGNSSYIIYRDAEYVRQNDEWTLTDPIIPNSSIDKVAARTARVAIIYGREDLSDVDGKFWSYEVEYELYSDVNNALLKTGILSLNFQANSGQYRAEAKADIPLTDTGVRLKIIRVRAEANGVAVENANLFTNGSSGDLTLFELVPTSIRLELAIDIEKYTFLKPIDKPNLSQVINISQHNSKLSWQHISGAESYQLAWRYVDDYDTEDYSTYSDDELFTNSTTVETPLTNYTVNLLYPKGKIYFRVRAIGRYVFGVGTDYTQYKYGSWSDKISVDLTANFNGDKSWQRTTSFAEEGKSKTIVSYFDESLRNRQTLTNLSTEQITLAAETKYDYEGRPTLNILPSPAPTAKSLPNNTTSYTYDPTLFYRNGDPTNPFSGINTTSGQTYSRRHFDKTDGPDPLDVSVGAGAANYFSENTMSTPTTESDFLPDAEGYPITQMAYTRDQTGRVRAQGGVGPVFQLDGRPTQYFYASASDTELRRLFGSAVGDSKYYKKNAVVDANGQVSVSYIDYAGRVVATALAGQAPENVEALDVLTALESDPNAVLTPKNFTENNQIFEEDGISIASYSFLHLSNTPIDYTFNYELDAKYISTQGGSVCLDCRYLLETVLEGPDGIIQPVSSDFPDPLTPISLPATTNCSDVVPNAYSAVYRLDKMGDYTYTKRLRIIPHADSDLPTLLGLPDLQSYLDSNFIPADDPDCYVTCLQQFSSDPVGLNNCIQDIMDEGNDLIEENRCGHIITQIEIDLSPDGWLYEDDNFLVSNSNLVTTVDLSGKTASEIRALWQEDWWQFYQTAHREYCHYEWCQNCVYFESRLYDQQMATYEVLLRYKNENIPYNSIKDVVNNLFPLANDPFFYSNNLPQDCTSNNPQPAVPTSYRTDFANKVGENGTYSNVPSYGAKDIFETIEETIPLPAIGAPDFQEKLAEQWKMYVAIYQYEKKIFEEQFVSTVLNCTYYDDDRTIVPSSQFPSELTTLGPNIGANVQNYNTGELTALCSDICEGNVENWIIKLAENCPALLDPANQSTLEDLKETLNAYCSNSCINGYNPFGVISNQVTTQGQTVLQTLYNDADALIKSICPTSDIDEIAREDVVYTYQTFNTTSNDVVPVNCVPCEVLSNYIDLGEWQGDPSGAKFWRAGDWDLDGLAAILKTSSTYTNYEITPFNVIRAILDCTESSNPIDRSFFTDYTSNFDNSCTNQPAAAVHLSIFSPYLANLVGCEGYFDINGNPPPCLIGPVVTVPGLFNCAKAKINSLFSPNPNTGGCNNILDLDAAIDLLGFEITENDFRWLAWKITGQYDCGAAPFGSTPTATPILTDLASVAGFCSNQITVVNNVTGMYEDVIPPDWDDQITQLCNDQVNAEGRIEWTRRWRALIDDALTTYQSTFAQECLSTPFKEEMYYTYPDYEYHYTLYYYDLAGNLVQTVPPKGVDVLGNYPDGYTNPADAFDIKGNWKQGTNPNHRLITRYLYNSLGQVRYQESPDAGISRFKYDYSQRLRVSQNAEQKLGEEYSYTKYDEFSRVVEVGEIQANIGSQFNDITETTLENAEFPLSADGTRKDITSTIYTQPRITSPIPQVNVRGRVSLTGRGALTTFYSYDAHGNVSELVHEYDQYEPQLFNVKYDYDLISGNVKQVSYQRDKADAFYHRYEYDADNRLTHVFTSEDNIIWEQDARYFYYLHGPLRRLELGHDKVQGLDYYYTLQGWIKGVNMPGINSSNYEPGRDGSLYVLGNFKNLLQERNRWIGQDEMSFALGYFKQDFKAVKEEDLGALGNWDWSSFGNVSNLQPLFNGNIAWMMTDLPAFDDPNGDRTGLQLMSYNYDQLHRIKEGKSNAIGQSLSDGTIIWNQNGMLDASYSYDPNGNLTFLKRYAPKNGQAELMDDLSYDYSSSAQDNKLKRVFDNVSNLTFSDDFDRQPGNNYEYDAIGNLTKDNSENATIEWDIYGKVEKVTIDPDPQGGQRQFTYQYYPSGERLAKIEEGPGITGKKYTVYSRDASGNILTVYEFLKDNPTLDPDTIVQKEVSLYGSSRLGVRKFANKIIYDENNGGTLLSPSTGIAERGNTYFELSNHLGNVLAVVTDQKQGVDDQSDGYLDYYKSSVVSANDYYAFGLQMPSRTLSSPEYRYGFNGKEKDERGEFGGLTHYDYGFRIYNPSIAKFLSVDPLTREFPWNSTYAFAENDVIRNIDLDGAEKLRATLWTNNGEIYKTILTVEGAGSGYTDREDGGILRSTNLNGYDKVTYDIYRDEDGGRLYAGSGRSFSTFQFDNEVAIFNSYDIIKTGGGYSFIKDGSIINEIGFRQTLIKSTTVSTTTSTIVDQLIPSSGSKSLDLDFRPNSNALSTNSVSEINSIISGPNRTINSADLKLTNGFKKRRILNPATINGLGILGGVPVEEMSIARRQTVDAVLTSVGGLTSSSLLFGQKFSGATLNLGFTDIILTSKVITTKSGPVTSTSVLPWGSTVLGKTSSSSTNTIGNTTTTTNTIINIQKSSEVVSPSSSGTQGRRPNF